MLVAQRNCWSCTKKSKAMIGLERNVVWQTSQIPTVQMLFVTPPISRHFPIKLFKKYMLWWSLNFFYFSHQTYVAKYLSYVQFSSFDLQLLDGLLLMIRPSKSSQMGVRCFGCSLLSKITLATEASITAIPISPTCRIARARPHTAVPVVTAVTAVTAPSHWVSFWYRLYTETKETF